MSYPVETCIITKERLYDTALEYDTLVSNNRYPVAHSRKRKFVEEGSALWYDDRVNKSTHILDGVPFSLDSHLIFGGVNAASAIVGEEKLIPVIACGPTVIINTSPIPINAGTPLSFVSPSPFMVEGLVSRVPLATDKVNAYRRFESSNISNEIECKAHSCGFFSGDKYQPMADHPPEVCISDVLALSSATPNQPLLVLVLP